MPCPLRQAPRAKVLQARHGVPAPREKAARSMKHVPPAASFPAVQRQAAGVHLMGDLHGCLCDHRLMHDAAHLEAFCQERVTAAGLTPVGSLFHRLPAF